MASSWLIQKVPVKVVAVAGQPTGEVAEEVEVAEVVVARVDAGAERPEYTGGTDVFRSFLRIQPRISHHVPPDFPS